MLEVYRLLFDATFFVLYFCEDGYLRMRDRVELWTFFVVNRLRTYPGVKIVGRGPYLPNKLRLEGQINFCSFKQISIVLQ